MRGARSIRLAAFAASLVAATGLAGCGGDGDDDQGTQPATPQPLTVAVDTLPRSLDPALARSVSERAVATAVHTPLLTYERRTDADAATLEPALARALPELSDDETEYRFTLRPGLLYADGRVVTASDVERAIAHASVVAADPEIREVLGGIIGAPSTDGRTLSGVRSDDRTGAIVVRLRRPDGRVPLALADPATAPLAELPRAGSDALPASTGSLRIARVTSSSVELVTNPLRPRIATVPAARATQISLTDRTVTDASLDRGLVDVDLQPSSIDDLPGGVETAEGATGEVWSLLLSPRGALVDRAARRSLAEAIDRRALDDGDGSDGAAPACGLLPGYVTGAVTRDDCPPAPVTPTGAGLTVGGIRLAVPRPSGSAASSGSSSGGSSTNASSSRRTTGAAGSTSSTTPTARSSTDRGTTAALAIVRSALGSAVAAGGEVVATDPAALLADGRADAALVRTTPSLPHPANWLLPSASVDALLAREIPRLAQGPLTGSADRWSELEERAVDRFVAVPLAVGRRSVLVGRSVSPASVLLHPVLGVDLTALAAR